MALSDKIRKAAFTLAVGSIGAVIGYVANDVVDVIGEVRKEAVVKEEVEANGEYMKRFTNQYIPPFANAPPPEYNVIFQCSGLGTCAF